MSLDEITITDDDDGQRLDRVLRRLRPTWSYVFTQKMIRTGSVKVNGKRAKVDARVAVGQTVRVPEAREAEQALGENRGPRAARTPRGQGPSASVEGRSQAIQVIYEDNELLVINKPAGLAVQGGSGLKVHLEMLLAPFERHGVRPRLVHRLDRETSGVMVLARTLRAARRLGEAFATRQVEKIYDALVSPAPSLDQGTIEAAMRKLEKGDVEKMMVDTDGDIATTDYRVQARKDAVAWVEFSPHTGRTHQIRVHAAHLGAPLLGDEKYGGSWPDLKKEMVKPRVMLHARSITLPHPRSGEAMTYTAPWPEDFKAVARVMVGVEEKPYVSKKE